LRQTSREVRKVAMSRHAIFRLATCERRPHWGFPPPISGIPWCSRQRDARGRSIPAWRSQFWSYPGMECCSGLSARHRAYWPTDWPRRGHACEALMGWHQKSEQAHHVGGRERFHVMSAFPPIATRQWTSRIDSFVPDSDISGVFRLIAGIGASERSIETLTSVT
jgi:hypothetical protein